MSRMFNGYMVCCTSLLAIAVTSNSRVPEESLEVLRLGAVEESFHLCLIRGESWEEIFIFSFIIWWVSQVVLVVMNLANAGGIRDVGLIPVLGRSPGGGNGNPLQYSCLENSMDRGAWRATVQSIAKSWTWLKWPHRHTLFGNHKNINKQNLRSELTITMQCEWRITQRKERVTGDW